MKNKKENILLKDGRLDYSKPNMIKLNNIQFTKQKDVELDDNTAGYVEGYIVTFGMIGSRGYIINKNAGNAVLKAKKNSVKLLYQHDTWQPIGSFVEFRKDDTGIIGRARVDNTELGRDVMLQVKTKTLDSFSIGAMIMQDRYVKIDGAKVRELMKLEIYESSIVTFPADNRAKFTTYQNLNYRRNGR